MFTGEIHGGLQISTYDVDESVTDQYNGKNNIINKEKQIHSY